MSQYIQLYYIINNTLGQVLLLMVPIINWTGCEPADILQLNCHNILPLLRGGQS